MRSFRFSVQPLVVLLLLAGLSVASAQSTRSSASATTPDWETLRPEGEEFTVLIPKGSTLESGKMPYHKMEVNARFYISKTPSGPVFAVVSLSGIKSNPALYTEMQRVNSYVDAFKNFFPPKVRDKVGPVKLALIGSKTLQGNIGREYSMTVGDLSGIVHAFATRKRFYAIVYLNSKKDDVIQDQFLSSFVLPEKVLQPPTTVASQTPARVPTNEQPVNKPGTDEADEAPVSEESADASPDTPNNAPDGAEPQPEKRGAISGGVLNGKAVSLPKPEYPAEAKAAGAAGSVVVQVIIDELGNVTAAKAISGHPLLQQVSVNAALQAKFSPTSLMGEPVKVNGSIVFNFVRP